MDADSRAPAITLPQLIDEVTGRIRCFKTCIDLSGGRPRADGWFRALLTHDFAIRAAHCNRSEARSPAVDTTTKLSRWHAVDACRKPFADAIETDENISPGTALRSFAQQAEKHRGTSSSSDEQRSAGVAYTRSRTTHSVDRHRLGAERDHRLDHESSSLRRSPEICPKIRPVVPVDPARRPAPRPRPRRSVRYQEQRPELPPRGRPRRRRHASPSAWRPQPPGDTPRSNRRRPPSKGKRNVRRSARRFPLRQRPNRIVPPLPSQGGYGGAQQRPHSLPPR